MFVLLIISSIPAYSAMLTDGINFYQPTNTAETVLDYAILHIKKDKLGFENYKLVKLTYSYDARKWHLLYSDGKRIYRTIMIDDIEPCNYETY